MSNTQESEQQLIERAQAALSRCNWEIGEYAAQWTKKYARGRGDADFGALIGLSGDQVYQRRRVWETFADVVANYERLKWSHFYAATNWPDAAECLQWAEDMGATVAEMKAWRRAQHGEDLAQPSEEEPPFVADGTPPFLSISSGFVQEAGVSDGGNPPRRGGRADSDSERDAVATTVAREAGGGDYAPFGKRARGSASEKSSATASAPPLQTLKRITSALQKVDAALTPDVLEVFAEAPVELQQRFLSSLQNLASKSRGLR